jgi:hypothetical protein
LAVSPSVVDRLAELRARDPALYRGGLASFGLLALALILGVLDDRLLLGVGVWLKPTKFAVSIGLYLWTLAWLRPYLFPDPPGLNLQAESTLRWARPVILGTMLFELICIFGQAARGVGSHFNVDTLMDGLIFQLMGAAILANTIALAAVTLRAVRATPAIAPALLWGIRLGFLLSVIGGVEGGIMAGRLAHTVGAPDGGPGLPLTAWSTQGGDLRVAHFLGLHAMQILPLMGHLFARLAGPDPARQRNATAGVIVLAMLWFAAFVITLLLALAARPLLSH